MTTSHAPEPDAASSGSDDDASEQSEAFSHEISRASSSGLALDERRALAVSASNWRTSKAPGARMLVPSPTHEVMTVHRVSRSRRDQAHRSNLHRLSHPRSRCSHNAAPSGWAGRLPAAELPWSSLSMRLARPLVRGAQVAAAKQRAGAQEDRMEVASPSPRPWRLLCCEGPLHAGLGFSA